MATIKFTPEDKNCRKKNISLLLFSTLQTLQMSPSYTYKSNTQPSNLGKICYFGWTLQFHCVTFHFLAFNQYVETCCGCPYSVMLISRYHSGKLSRQNAEICTVLFRVSSCGVGCTVLSLVSVSYTLAWDHSHHGRISLFYLPPHLQFVSLFSQIFVHRSLRWYESRSWRTPSPSRVPHR